MKPLLLGIDIGTSACKAALFGENGQLVAQESEPYPIYYPKLGWVEQDPAEWWVAVCKALKRLFCQHDSSRIAAIGVDGQSWSAVAIDSCGVPLMRTPIWMDTRAEALCERLPDDIKERVFEISGNPLKPSYTVPKVLWIKESMPEVFKKTQMILQSNSYIGFMLTGILSQEKSQGYGLSFFDLRKGIYDEELRADMGLPKSLFPDIFDCHDIVGLVSREASRLTGLFEGTPVVAGGLDAACGALGAGVSSPGQTQEQGGQAGGMSICLDVCKTDKRLISGFHVVKGKWLLQGGTVGGGSLKWLRDSLFPGMAFDELTQLAQSVPPGSDGLVFLPYMSGERSPIWDPSAKGVFFGLDYSKTAGHMVRAVMEGVAFSLKHNLDIAKEAGACANELYAIGGAANSRIWTQIKADVTGKPISVPSSDTATTLGAAMLAGVGAGVFGTFEEAASLVGVSRRHEPEFSNHESYLKSFGVYREIYENLKGISK
jgi:xylulokinase